MAIVGGVGLMDAMDGEANARLMKRARDSGCITTVDIFAGSADDLPDVAAVLPWTDYFMPSIEEARALSGREDLEDAALELNDKLWRVKATMPKPAPTGEADGELYLFLIEDEA